MADYDIDKISDIIHGRLRLGVMAYLSNSEAATFTELKSALNVTQGNLSVQMRKLAEAGYVKIEKAFVDEKPLTTLHITPTGRKAFSAYLQALFEILGGSI
jgi:DNA-binding MarR family transcriptional regulator